jgi:hypothetical protein
MKPFPAQGRLKSTLAAIRMLVCGIAPPQVIRAWWLSMQDGGVSDLMHMWLDHEPERQETLLDIERSIEDYKQ